MDSPGGIVLLLKSIKHRMADPAMYDTFATWGEAAEDAMLASARAMLEFDTYDVTFSECLGAGRLVGRPIEEEQLWLPCSKLTITHSYFDSNDVELGTYERHCYFGHTEDGRITMFATEEHIDNYTAIE